MRLWKSGPIVPFTNSPQGENSKSYAMALPHSAMHPEHPAPTAFKGSKVRAGFPCRARSQGAAIRDSWVDMSFVPFPPWTSLGPLLLSAKTLRRGL